MASSSSSALTNTVIADNNNNNNNNNPEQQTTCVGWCILPNNESSSFEGADDYKVLQEKVHGFLEMVPGIMKTASRFDIYVNEEGVLKNMEPNPVGTIIALACGANTKRPFRGPILIVGREEEGDVPSLLASDIERLEDIKALIVTDQFTYQHERKFQQWAIKSSDDPDDDD